MSCFRARRSLALVGSIAIATCQAQTITLSPAAKASEVSALSQAMSPSFAGMGIEPSNLFSFTGGEDANELSINLLQNLANYSGAPPHLRIGGNTEDYIIYDSSYTGYSVEKNPNSSQQGAENAADEFLIGPSYFKALNRFPTNTPVTYGLNLAYNAQDYVDKIVAEAAAAIEYLTNLKVYSFEIGNEPDLYLQSWDELRNGTWNGQVYTEQWLLRAAAVAAQVLKPNGYDETFFETACTASTIATTFTIDDLVSDGITASVNGTKYVSSWNQHDYFYFIGISTVTLTLDDLMNFDNTESQFAYWTTEVTAALKTGLPYNLREMQSVGPEGLQGLTDTFGATLWYMNFFLYAASLNISSVQMHMTDNSYAAPWQPININDAAPHVRSTYYAWAAVAQLLGAGNSTTQITALTTNNSYIRCYAAYAESALSSLVIINAQQVNASETKTNATFEVELPAYAGKTLYISYLTAAGADSTENTTWNGISYEQDSVGTAVTIDDTSYTITVGGNGVATIPVRDSQAVIAHIGSKLGSETVETVSSTGSGSSSSSSSSTSSSSSSSSSSKKSSAASSYSATSSSGSSTKSTSTSAYSTSSATSTSASATSTSSSSDSSSAKSSAASESKVNNGLGFILLFVASCIARGFMV